MEKIEEKILKRYGIDIRTEKNIFKIYGIKSPNLTPSELEQILSARRAKWNTAANSQNEKVAATAQNSLKLADGYEAILRDDALRSQLFAYYQKEPEDAAEDLQHARHFFQLVKQTKRITNSDVDFYFAYFSEERKKKKAILQMLKDEYKVRGLKEDKDELAETETAAQQETGKKQSVLVVNLFRKQTLLMLKKCEGFYADAAKRSVVRAHYPQMDASVSVYEFLQLERCDSLKNFAQQVSALRNEVQGYRTEFGTDFTPMADLFNTLYDLTQEKDVCDNFGEFKLLLKYPLLSPYMFEFEDVKPATLKEFYSYAAGLYDFDNMDLFVTDYFAPIHDNFGIYDHALQPILKKAARSTQTSRLRHSLFEKFAALTHLPAGIKMAHILTWWPIFLVYFLFELLKAAMTNLRKLSIIGVVGFSAIWLIRSIVSGDIADVLPQMTPQMGYGFISGVDVIVCIGMILCVACMLIGIVAGVIYILWEYAASINKFIDWIGIERTFHRLMLKCRTISRKKQRKAAGLPEK